MRLAASIRYGGELINANEVDYQAYRHLGLICPHCSAPVFLAAAHKRYLSKGQETDIPAQFRHFKASDPVLVQQCVARVAQYDQKEVERRASAARHQRAKLLQRWFWTIFSRRAEGLANFLEDPEVAEMRVMCTTLVPQIRDFFANSSEDNLDHALKFLLQPFENDPEITDERLKRDLRRLTQLDQRLHLAICKEVLKFLQSRANTYMFDQLIVGSIGLAYYGEISRKRLEEGSGITRIVYARMLGMLCIVPWADEFQSLQRCPKTSSEAVYA